MGRSRESTAVWDVFLDILRVEARALPRFGDGPSSLRAPTLIVGKPCTSALRRDDSC